VLEPVEILIGHSAKRRRKPAESSRFGHDRAVAPYGQVRLEVSSITLTIAAAAQCRRARLSRRKRFRAHEPERSVVDSSSVIVVIERAIRAQAASQIVHTNTF